MSSSIASSVLRRALSRGLLLAAPIGKPRSFSSLSPPSLLSRVSVARTLTNPCSAVAVRHGSSVNYKPLDLEEKIKRADENLVRVLESEIENSQESGYEPHKEVSLPEDCPFEIIDNPGDQSITLKRQFHDENIEVAVFINFEEQEEEEEETDDDDEDNKNDEDNGPPEPEISLVVNVKKAGADRTLEFCCTVDSEDLHVQSMELKPLEAAADEDESSYKGPDFSELDGGLQKAVRRYLVVRGIKPKLYGFLQEYMPMKEDKEYVVWLKNLKEFVGKGGAEEGY